jgi:two-component system, response regulator YesN
MKDILVMDCEERGAFWLTLRSNHSILFVTTAEEGLEMLSENIGLVFVSLTLRDMDSMELLGLIIKKYPSTAVVIIAPCGDEPCRCVEAFRKGAWDYIKKPLKAEEVLRKIRIFMDGESGSQRQHPASISMETVMHEQYPTIPSHIAKGVLRVRDFVAQNYSESLSLAAACKMAATSKTYFCRFFKRITGHSLRSYHNVVRVRMAEQLLRDRRLSVADVAVRLGYHDSNYFSTIYKRMTGTPPKCRKTAVQSLGMIRRTREGLDGTLKYVEHEHVS